MVTTRILGCLLLGTGLWGANINITVTGVTPTQAVIKYSATSPNACTIALSESVTMTPLVNDVNPALFAGASSDSRPGSISSGVARTVVLGKRSIERALDGANYSRALQAYTTHYLLVTCGSDSGKAIFRTENPPLGNNAPDVPLFDSGAFGNYAQPTINFSDQSVTYIDPLTGILLKRATSPSDTLDISAANQSFSAVADPTSAWTNPSKIIGSSGLASYGGSGTASAYLFLTAPISIAGLRGYSDESNVVDARLRLNGSGTDSSAANRILSACISQDHGQTCQGATVDLPALPQGSLAPVQFPSAYPSLIFKAWTAANGVPVITPNLVVRSGNVTVSGTSLTLNSGDTFQDLVPGDVITIPGSGCSNSDECVIAAVLNAKHLTLTTSSSLTANYTAANFGLKIWKKTTTGTVSVNGAKFDYALDAVLQMPVAGAYSQCSRLPAPTTVDRSGNPLGFSQNGYLCVQAEIWGNAHLYWHGTNGEVRFISALVRNAVSTPPADSVGLGYMCPVSGGAGQLSPFDSFDPNSLYCVGTKTGSPTPIYDVIYKCTYNPSAPVGGGYREWTDYTMDNPAESCLNITKASLHQDLNSQGVPSGYFIAAGNTSGPYLTFAPLVNQNGMAYYVRFNTTTNLVEFVHDSWSTSPRWGTLHGTAGIGVGFGGLFIAPMRSQGAAGQGQYQAPITAVQGLGNTGLTNTYVDSQTCQQLGVTDPAFIAQGARGHACISVTVTGEPYNPAPAASDLAKYPWPHNSASCGGDDTTTNCWTQLQPAIEGDFIMDGAENGYYEQFRIVKKLNSTWILQRGASQADCTVTQMTPHANGWTPVMIPAGLCSAVSYYFNTSNNAVSFDSANMNTSHNDLITDGVSDYGTFVQSGYDIRVGPLSTNIGKPATFHSFGSYSPTFAGSTASVQTFGIQSHPSARQFDASAAEFRWILDGRPYGGAAGGSTALFYHAITATAIADVYKVGPPTSGPNGTGTVMSVLDRKRLPMQVWAGRYLLQDKSGPGSTLLAGDTWKYCVADFAGECIAGSPAGSVYMNVPQADINGLCASQLEVNTPCWVSASPVAPFITQVGIDRADATGLYWRRISNFFNGLGWTDNFWNARSLPDASWAFSNAKWLNGVRSEIMMAKLPPWPADDTIQRNNFVSVSIQINGTSQRSYRIRFGYDTNLYCTTRQEQCATVVNGPAPFQWVSEQKPWLTCNGLCKITIPAISGRVLYYVVDASDPSGNVSSTAMNAFPVQ